MKASLVWNGASRARQTDDESIESSGDAWLNELREIPDEELTPVDALEVDIVLHSGVDTHGEAQRVWLTRAQREGLACIRCGHSHLQLIPFGFLVGGTGERLYVCAPKCEDLPTRW